MVTLTENAAREIKRQLAAAGSAAASVRVGLEAGGCAGTKYVITPGAGRQDGDKTASQFDLTVLVDPVCQTRIEGLKIDFVDALMGGGFRFENPNAASSCGCGASFRATGPEPVEFA